MGNVSYYPILKWKKGEQNALKTLGPISDKIIPVLELVCDDDDDIPMPDEFFTTVTTCFDGPFFFDTIQCDDDERSVLKSYIKYAKNLNIPAWPMLFTDDLSEVLPGIKNSVTKFAFSLPAFEDINSLPAGEIFSLLTDQYGNNKISLFLDAGLILDSNQARMALFAYKQLILEKKSQLIRFDQIVICLSSFPKDIPSQSGEMLTFTRYDIQIFDNIFLNCPQTVKAQLAYADYGVSKFTDTKLEPYMYARILPKIKYTSLTKYIVYIGKRDRMTNRIIRSHTDLAKELIQSDDYKQFGKDFSDGDAAIYEKATNYHVGPGNNQQWVTFCVNHHITVLVAQLASLNGV